MLLLRLRVVNRGDGSGDVLMAMQELVMTAVGLDRPGLVEELSGYLHGAGANLADSRMVNLGGQFALIVRMRADDQVIEKIRSEVGQVGRRMGLTVSIGLDGGDQASRRQGLPLRLRVDAMDQPGIVHRITNLLLRHQINIEELQTRLVPGSHSGTPLFNLELCMTVPTTVQVKVLREELVELCDSLNCDGDLEPI